MTRKPNVLIGNNILSTPPGPIRKSISPGQGHRLAFSIDRNEKGKLGRSWDAYETSSIGDFNHICTNGARMGKPKVDRVVIITLLRLSL